MQCGDGYSTRKSRLVLGGNSMKGGPAFPRETSKLLRAASLPNVGRGNQSAAFSSITISTRNVTKSRSSSYECVFASPPIQPLFSATSHPPESSRSRQLTSACRSMHAPCSQPDLCRRSPIISWWEEVKLRYSTVNKEHQRPSTKWSKRANSSTEQDLQGFMVAAGDQDVRRDSFSPLPSLPLHRSWVHLQLPLKSSFSVVFWDKPLLVPLEGPESRRAIQRCLHRSTCSLRLGASARQRPPIDREAATETETAGGGVIHRTFKPTPAGGHKCSVPGCNWVPPRGPQPNQQRPHMVEGPALAQGVDYKANDSETLLEILSFRAISRRPAEACGGNEDEAQQSSSSQSNFKLHLAFGASPESKRKEGRQTCVYPGEPQSVSATTAVFNQRTACYNPSPSTACSPDGPPDPLTLKEALELLRPDFISRSQGRLKCLEQRVRRRRRRSMLEDYSLEEEQGLGGDAGQRRRNCTTPHPLSDNLFQPRERSISGREMQLRSRRMYYKLPEVARRREEERKKAVSQSNRLRAELFKKRLLEQVLQR
ncbi:unnamed protein product [Lota lota]